MAVIIQPLYDTQMCDLYAYISDRWTQSYILRHNKHRRLHITEPDITEMDKQTREYHELFMETIKPHMKSSANTNKYHKQGHFTQELRAKGPSRDHSAQFYEMLMGRTKCAYRWEQGFCCFSASLDCFQ